MGRLFWKFFAFIWLAQLGGIVAIGTAFWLTAPHPDRSLELAFGPGAGTRVGAAAAIFNYAGMDGFRAWAQQESRNPVFAVDDSGSDILRRPLGPGMVLLARHLHEEEPRSPLVSEVAGADGRHYLLFAAERDLGTRGAPPPPDGAANPPRPPEPPGRPGGPPGGTLRALPLAPTLATLVASLLTAVLLAWYVAKPIRGLRTAFEGAARGDLNQRVMPLLGNRHDELADLGRDFDRMAERLQAAMEGQRRLLHDVSHEVRSPLARLQAAVGLLRRKYAGDEQTVERIEEEIVRIDRLIGDLLRLSRIEAGELAGQEEDVDLYELVTEIVADANFEAQGSGRSVIWHNGAAASVRGRPEMLRMAIENVIRNALKHAPLSRDITVETSVDAAHTLYTLRVLDSGPGVPAAELAQMFTPFFRSVQGAGTDGYGLGLAIARRSLEAHGGHIRAVNRAAGGLAVDIELPLSSPLPPPLASAV